MNVTFILPALTEAVSPYFRPIKYSLFPPLGLATLAAYLDPGDHAALLDEHVEPVRGDDTPDVVAIQVYITNARRAYALADDYRRRGVHVVLGGLHVTALPDEARQHVDTLCLGPGEDTWPRFLADFRRGRPQAVYTSTERTLAGQPFPRRDLIRRDRYFVPNSIVVSRGCPHHCDFCYKDAFFQGGKSFYTQRLDRILAEIDSLPGRHLFFLDDHLFGDDRFIRELLTELRGLGRVWQAAGTVEACLRPGLMELAAASGLRSLFIGFETLNPSGLQEQGKLHNLGRDYERAVRRLHSLGIMVNGSFVFGFDADPPEVFDRTVDWAIRNGIETATFHILTPYPGTALQARLQAAGRITSHDWDRYDTRHAVFTPARMSAAQLEAGYWRAYEQFYAWSGILRAATSQDSWLACVRHLAYTGAWKKLEPVWSFLIHSGLLGAARPLLEAVLNSGGTGLQRRSAQMADATPSGARNTLVPATIRLAPTAVTRGPVCGSRPPSTSRCT